MNDFQLFIILKILCAWWQDTSWLKIANMNNENGYNFHRGGSASFSQPHLLYFFFRSLLIPTKLQWSNRDPDSQSVRQIGALYGRVWCRGWRWLRPDLVDQPFPQRSPRGPRTSPSLRESPFSIGWLRRIRTARDGEKLLGICSGWWQQHRNLQRPQTFFLFPERIHKNILNSSGEDEIRQPVFRYYFANTINNRLLA